MAIGKIIETWAEKGENLEKTFLRTAENCEEMFKRLDSGISHIESSISEHKMVVDRQSDLIDKNSGYLDNKLGEYGKLISLEVEAMIERSNTLEQNIQTQMNSIRSTAEEVTEIFSQLGSDMSEKRKLIETESLRVMNNINVTVSNLDEEVNKLKDFYNKAQDKNGDLTKVFSIVSSTLKDVEAGLLETINSFNEKSEDIISRFQSVNGLVSGNINKMIETSEQFSEQSKVNAGLLVEQDEYVNKALDSLKSISTKLSSLNKELNNTAGTVGKTLDVYEKKMDDFGKIVGNHLGELNENYEKTKEQLVDFNQIFKTASIDTFMKNSADIIKELETIAIDVNSIFDKSGNEDSLWKKYYEGDHGVFIRHLSKNMTKKEIIAIKEDYEKKPDFRVIVDKYLDDFDALIDAAKNNNRSSTLFALISGADIG